MIHVLWSNFNVELENHAYYTIRSYLIFKKSKFVLGQAKKGKVNLTFTFLDMTLNYFLFIFYFINFDFVKKKIRFNAIITVIFELYAKIELKTCGT